MSHLNDIILVTAIEEGASKENEHPNVDLVNSYLQKEHHCALVRVDQFAGGGKKIQSHVFMAAINHLNISEFVSHFYAVPWAYPESVQLMLKDEHEERFTIYQPEK